MFAKQVDVGKGPSVERVSFGGPQGGTVDKAFVDEMNEKAKRVAGVEPLVTSLPGVNIIDTGDFASREPLLIRFPRTFADTAIEEAEQAGTFGPAVGFVSWNKRF